MVNSIEVFDPCVGCWRIGDPMNSNRGYATTAVLGHSVYVLGACGGGQDPSRYCM